MLISSSWIIPSDLTTKFLLGAVAWMNLSFVLMIGEAFVCFATPHHPKLSSRHHIFCKTFQRCCKVFFWNSSFDKPLKSCHRACPAQNLTVLITITYRGFSAMSGHTECRISDGGWLRTVSYGHEVFEAYLPKILVRNHISEKFLRTAQWRWNIVREMEIAKPLGWKQYTCPNNTL